MEFHKICLMIYVCLSLRCYPLGTVFEDYFPGKNHLLSASGQAPQPEAPTGQSIVKIQQTVWSSADEAQTRSA